MMQGKATVNINPDFLPSDMDNYIWKNEKITYSSESIFLPFSLYNHFYYENFIFLDELNKLETKITFKTFYIAITGDVDCSLIF